MGALCGLVAPNWLSDLIEKKKKRKVWDLEISELFSGSFIHNQDYNSLCFLPATPYPTPSPSNSCPRLHLKLHLAHSLSSLIPSPPLAPPQLVTVHPAVSLNFCCSDARQLHHTPFCTPLETTFAPLVWARVEAPIQSPRTYKY